MPAVVDRCDERCGDHGPDARQLREPLAGFVRPANGKELPVELIESEIEGVEFFEELAEEFPRELRKLGGRYGVGCLRQKAPRALGQNDAILAKKPPRMIDECSPSADDALPCAM
jgi:hypothetical protein